MQFLAAKSRWTSFIEARYCIPFAICKHMSISLMLVWNTCISWGGIGSHSTWAMDVNV